MIRRSDDLATSQVGPRLISPEVHEDERGFFFESFNQRELDHLVGHHVEFVQDNHSKSSQWVVRGLHYQLPPAAQGKLVRAIEGAIFDVAVDIRRSSPRLGSWEGHLLSADNHRQLWVPPGFAHGFLVVSSAAQVLYKTTAYYEPQHERSIRWDDPIIGIDWPLDGNQPILSPRDGAAPSLADAELFD